MNWLKILEVLRIIFIVLDIILVLVLGFLWHKIQPFRSQPKLKVIFRHKKKDRKEEELERILEKEEEEENAHSS
ncbi:MAG: hypothetical protein Q8L36_01935 [bacterium]|nr:hypothetical protein [bacterium]